jgi:hypothetical protein
MFAYRHMRLLVAAALCAGSVQALAADGAGQSPAGKSFGRLELQGQWLSPTRFGPSSAFFSAPLGEEIVTPPVRSRAEPVWPEPATSPPVDARAAVTPKAEETAPRPSRASTAAKRSANPAPPRAAAKRAPSNPMNSFARDTQGSTQGNRRQAWPCSGGGICAWR